MSEAITYKRYPMGNYMVGSNGSVFSIKDGRFKNLHVGNKGYILISLYENGKHITRSLHRIVMNTFFGESNLVVNHKNGNKLDNSIENLEYTTSSGNSYHRWSSTGKRFVTRLKSGKFYIQIQTPNNGRIRKSVSCENIEEAYDVAYEMYYKLFGFEPWSKNE